MSFSDFLKKAGIVEEVADEKVVPTPPSTNSTASGNQPQKGTFIPGDRPASPLQSFQQPAAPASLTTNVGVVDNKYVDHFVQTLDGVKAKYPDADYYSFKKAFDNTESLQGSILESVRYQMVFGALAANGLVYFLLRIDVE